MLTERLQVLIDRTRRRRLEAAARARGVSVASLVREAIDARLEEGGREERIRAAAEIRAMSGGRFVSPAKLDRIAEAERDEEIARVSPRR